MTGDELRGYWGIDDIGPTWHDIDGDAGVTEVVDGRPGQRHRAIVTDMMVFALDCKGGKNVENVGECADGCCDNYRCGVCGETFRVEWPQ